MKKMIAVAALILVGSAGCIQARHVEHYSAVSAGLSTDGAVTLTQQVSHEDRTWTGPWLAQPSTISRLIGADPASELIDHKR